MDSWKTKVRLYDNVPFSSNYESTRWFGTKAEQTTYFASLGHTVETTNGNYVRVHDGKVLLQGLKDVKDKYNYMVIENFSTITNNVRTYYCFIKEVQYDSANGSIFEIEVDVLQTYMFDLKFNKSFVERSHMPRWKSNGRPVVNVAPENVNIGSEYQTVSVANFSRAIDNYFEVMVVTTTKPLHYKFPDTPIRTGVMSGVATPMMYYMVLVPKEAQRNKNLKWRVLVNNEKYLYEWSESGGAKFMQGVHRSLDIFNAGDSEVYANRIVNIAYLPFFPFNASVSVDDSGGGRTYKVDIDPDFIDVQNLVTPSYHAIHLKGHPATRITNAIQTNIYDRVKSHMNANGLSESKLLMYPFTVATLYDNLGGAFEIKPQYTNDGAVSVDALTSISASPKSAYIVKNYLGHSNLSNGIVSNVNADIEVLNDNSATYMQGRKNSDAVAMSQAKGNMLMQTGMGVGMMGVGVATLNPMLLMAGAGMGFNSINNGFNNIQSIIAKQEDAKNIPPSVAGQVGATNLVLGYELILPRIEIKTMSVEYARTVENYFKMYGVAVNELINIPLRTRTHFNFIKTVGANITGGVPTNALNKIINVFDNGITLWHTNDMYNYSLHNNER